MVASTRHFPNLQDRLSDEVFFLEDNLPLGAAIIGGQALLRYVPGARSTFDIDLAVIPSAFQETIDLLEERGYDVLKDDRPNYARSASVLYTCTQKKEGVCAANIGKFDEPIGIHFFTSSDPTEKVAHVGYYLAFPLGADDITPDHYATIEELVALKLWVGNRNIENGRLFIDRRHLADVFIILSEPEIKVDPSRVALKLSPTYDEAVRISERCNGMEASITPEEVQQFAWDALNATYNLYKPEKKSTFCTNYRTITLAKP